MALGWNAMLSTLGISDWVTAAIVTWLAVQLPLGIAVGVCLRRVNVLSTVDVTEFYATAQIGPWSELRAAPVPVLR